MLFIYISTYKNTFFKNALKNPKVGKSHSELINSGIYPNGFVKALIDVFIVVNLQIDDST